MDAILIRRANICLPRLEHLKNYGGGAIIHSATNKYSTLLSTLSFYQAMPNESSHRTLEIAVEDCENYLIHMAKNITLQH